MLAEQVIDDARRVSDIIDRIRGMALKRGPEFVSLRVNDAVEKALLVARHESQRRSLDLAVRLEPDLPPVLGDRVQIPQVIINLAVNVIQAMAATGGGPRRLTVATGRGEGGEVVASASDTGPGIGAADLEKLFTGSSPPRSTVWARARRSAARFCRPMAERSAPATTARARASSSACRRRRARSGGFRLRIEPLRHARKIGERPRSHLLHHRGAIELHRDLAEAELRPPGRPRGAHRGQRSRAGRSGSCRRRARACGPGCRR